MKKIIPCVILLGLLAGCSDDPADCNMTSAVEFYIQNNKEIKYRGRQPDVSIDYIKSHVVKKIERTGSRHSVYGTPICKVTYVNIDYENDLRVATMLGGFNAVPLRKESTACYVFKNSISGPVYEAVRGEGCCNPFFYYYQTDADKVDDACWF